MRRTTYDYTRKELEEMAAAVAFWFHSIDLGSGVVTNGWKTPAMLVEELERLRLPDLSGKTVLDVNTWDGFYAFEAERRGARHVVALDEYMWAMDLDEHRKYWEACRRQGTTPRPYHTMPYYKPVELPGKKGFDTAHRALGSSVEVVVGDFMTVDLERLGRFDIVLFLGTLYHMESPLEALRRVAAVTRELAVVETEAVAFAGLGNRAVCEFFESDELNGDVSNWWAPNDTALAGMCRAAGFARVETITGPPRASTASAEPLRYRAVVQAFK